jgi:uncharacterized repeat protein (TIGR02543 family)
LERSNATFDGCIFSENSATEKGGAVFLGTDSFHTQNIINSSFYQNIAPEHNDVCVEYQSGTGGVVPDPIPPRKSVQLFFSSFADNSQSNPETQLWQHSSVSAFATLRFGSVAQPVLPNAENSYNAVLPFDLEAIPQSGHLLSRTGQPIPKTAFQSLLGGKLSNSLGDFYVGSNVAPSTTIFLEANGGSVSSNQISVLYGQDISFPAPEKTGYTFSGWLASNGQAVNPDKLVFGAIETLGLSANWTANTYSASFISNGSLYSENSQTFDAPYSLPLTPKRQDYKFIGWFSGENGTGQKISADDLYLTNGNVTLFAHWEKTFPAWAIVAIIIGSVLFLASLSCGIIIFHRKKLAKSKTAAVDLNTSASEILQQTLDDHNPLPKETEYGFPTKQTETLDCLAEKNNLTAREKEVAALIIQGKTRKEIAEALFISIGTVRKHTQNIYMKLRVKSKLELLKKMQKL